MLLRSHNTAVNAAAASQASELGFWECARIPALAVGPQPCSSPTAVCLVVVFFNAIPCTLNSDFFFFPTQAGCLPKTRGSTATKYDWLSFLHKFGGMRQRRFPSTCAFQNKNSIQNAQALAKSLQPNNVILLAPLMFKLKLIFL